MPTDINAYGTPSGGDQDDDVVCPSCIASRHSVQDFHEKKAQNSIEAIHEGHTTSSSWSPPLGVPYALMSVGMTLLTLQLLLQFLNRLLSGSKPGVTA